MPARKKKPTKRTSKKSSRRQHRTVSSSKKIGDRRYKHLLQDEIKNYVHKRNLRVAEDVVYVISKIKDRDIAMQVLDGALAVMKAMQEGDPVRTLKIRHMMAYVNSCGVPISKSFFQEKVAKARKYGVPVPHPEGMKKMQMTKISRKPRPKTLQMIGEEKPLLPASRRGPAPPSLVPRRRAPNAFELLGEEAPLLSTPVKESSSSYFF